MVVAPKVSELRPQRTEEELQFPNFCGCVVKVSRVGQSVCWSIGFCAPTAHPQHRSQSQVIVDLISDPATGQGETNPGYDRIQGALANVGYHISDTTVGNILKTHGESSPALTGRAHRRVQGHRLLSLANTVIGWH